MILDSMWSIFHKHFLIYFSQLLYGDRYPHIHLIEFGYRKINLLKLMELMVELGSDLTLGL